jgi:hypothetical protein
VSEEGGDGEGPDSEPLSLLSYTLKYISLTDGVILCQRGLAEGGVGRGRYKGSKVRTQEREKKNLKRVNGLYRVGG